MSSITSALHAINRSHLITVAGVAGAAFFAYCVYFDHKRRAAPDFRAKLRERRRRDAEERNKASSGRMRVLRNPTEAQAFFMEEVRLGEELLSSGLIELGLEHLSNAIVLCGQAEQLLAIFQQTLSEQQYVMLLEKLPQAHERVRRMWRGAVENDAPADDGPRMAFMAPSGSAGAAGLIDPELE